MEDQTNEPQVVEETEVEEVEETTPAEPTDDIHELKARLQRLEEKSITQRERTRLLKQELEKAKKAAAPKEPVAEKKTGELDETQLDYLDLKGITEQEDIDVIQKVMRTTGLTVRQALKDEYVVSKLEAHKKDREVKTATPSSTKRSGSPLSDVEGAIAKYQRDGSLPEDFALRSAVVNAIYERENKNKPGWK